MHCCLTRHKDTSLHNEYIITVACGMVISTNTTNTNIFKYFNWKFNLIFNTNISVNCVYFECSFYLANKGFAILLFNACDFSLY